MGNNGSSQRGGGGSFLDDPWKSLGLVYYPEDNDSDDDDTDIDRVLDGLYVGGMHGAMDLKGLHQRGVTHVLNMATYSLYPKAHHASHFEYKIVGLEDLPSARIMQHFEDTNRFITQGRQRGAVYVHCFAGMSRAPTAVIAFLMAEHGMSLREAASTVKAARRQALPNRGFWNQLQEYEKELAASGGGHRDNRDSVQWGEAVVDAPIGASSSPSVRLGGGCVPRASPSVYVSSPTSPSRERGRPGAPLHSPARALNTSATSASSKGSALDFWQ